MQEDKIQKYSLGAIRSLFLTCFAGLLVLEIALGFLALRYSNIQNGILRDQTKLLRAREFLSDALRDSEQAWSSSTKASENSSASQTTPPSASQAVESISLLKGISTPSLAFEDIDLERLDSTLSNNSKLLSTPLAQNQEQTNLIEKTLTSLKAFIAAIDIRLFGSMQDFRRESEFLQMIAWGLIPVLIATTFGFGILLHARVMEPLKHLKKQSRRLTDNIVSLQKELRVFEIEKKKSVIPEAEHPAPRVENGLENLPIPAAEAPVSPQP